MQCKVRFRVVEMVQAVGVLGHVPRTAVGPTGAGVEYGFAPNWSVKVEYLHAAFDSSNFNTRNVGTVFAAPTAPQTINHSVSSTVDIVRAGVNWRFGGPVVARY